MVSLVFCMLSTLSFLTLEQFFFKMQIKKDGIGERLMCSEIKTKFYAKKKRLPTDQHVY